MNRAKDKLTNSIQTRSTIVLPTEPIEQPIAYYVRVVTNIFLCN